MKHMGMPLYVMVYQSFSALGRAVWDETLWRHAGEQDDVSFSALGRAVWDETRR